MNLTKKLGLIISCTSITILTLLIFLFISYQSSQQQACALSCGSEMEQCTISTCPYQNNNFITILIWVSGILVAGLGGAGVLLSLEKKEIIEKKIIDLTNLTSLEKKAFKLINTSSKGIFQSKLAKELDLSKVQTTRLLDKLEQNNLIERKRRGMTNIVLSK